MVDTHTIDKKGDSMDTIQKKRRLIIDRIAFLKSLEWGVVVKKWVNDLHDELEEIDENIGKPEKCNCPWQRDFEECKVCTMRET